jgi:hypothetical protein
VVETLLNPDDDEWVMLVGRYILNMGVLEMATREWIAETQGESAPVIAASLAKRIEFIRKRFPRDNPGRYESAMTIFEVADRHTQFRNTVAHSPLVITDHADGSFHIRGLLDVPSKPGRTPSLVSVDELRGRVNESNALATRFREMLAEVLALKG